MPRTADCLPFINLLGQKEPQALSEIRPWLLGGFDTVEDDFSLSGWDYQQDLELSRRLTVDCTTVAEHCRLGRQASIRILANWTTTASAYLRGASSSEDIPVQRGKQTVEIRIDIPGRCAGATMTLATLICLGSSRSRDPIAPKRPGSVIWQDRLRLHLEGNAARMPIAVADFAGNRAIPAGPDAAWYVRFGPGCLERSVSTGIQVFVNAAKSEIVKAIEADPTSLTSFQRAVRSFLRFDVGRQLIEYALADDDFIDAADVYDPGTLGWAAHSNLATCFPHLDGPREVARLKKHHPTEFAAQLQQGLGLLAD